MVQMNDLNILPARGADEAARLNGEAAGILEIAKCYEIDSHEMYAMAADELKKIKARAKELDEKRRAITGPLDEVKKQIMGLFNPPLQMLEQAEAILKLAIGSYHAKMDQKLREAEAQAQAHARKERERLNKFATIELEKGNEEKAAMLQEQATFTQPIAAVQPKAKASGISTREIWHAEITDKMALIKAVAAGQVSHTVIDANMIALNKIAVALKGDMNYPGVCAVMEKSIAARA
ncbi:MAG: hypothetical protein KGI54_15605 [Pseudomonadota bacterium]|nr:hypothetical protein [Pseudomonadota bacterium]